MHINTNINFIKMLTGFSLVGFLTTLISLFLIFLFLKLFKTPLLISYIGIYLTTIIISFILNSFFVFKSKVTFVLGFKYFTVYLSGMLLGTLMLWILKKILPFENYILGYIVLPFTMAWNFMLTYKLLNKK